jgi:hypothetical protein
MAFMELNGVVITAANTQVGEGKPTTRGGELSRAAMGQVRNPKRGHRRVWEATTVHATLEETRALMLLLSGVGQHFEFEVGLESAKSMGPLPGYKGFYLDPSAANAFGGTGCIVTDGATTGPILRYDAQIPDDTKFVVSWHEYDGTFKHYVRTGAGEGWVDGVQNNSVGVAGGGVSTLSVLVIDGMVTLSMDAAVVRRIDDLVILPYSVPDSWIESPANMLSAKGGPLPILRATGDFIYEDATYVFGEITGPMGYMQRSQLNELTNMSTWETNARILPIRLTEVNEAYLRDLDVPEVLGTTPSNDPPVQGAPIPDFSFEAS